MASRTNMRVTESDATQEKLLAEHSRMYALIECDNIYYRVDIITSHHTAPFTAGFTSFQAVYDYLNTVMDSLVYLLQVTGKDHEELGVSFVYDPTNNPVTAEQNNLHVTINKVRDTDNEDIESEVRPVLTEPEYVEMLQTVQERRGHYTSRDVIRDLITATKQQKTQKKQHARKK